MSLKSLSIRGKLLAAFGLMLALVIGLGAMSALQIRLVNGSARDLRDNWVPSIQAIGEVKLTYSRERTRAARAMGTPDAAERRNAVTDYQAARSELERALRTYEPLVSSREEQALLDRFKADYRTYSNFVDDLLAQPPGDARAMAAFNGESVRLWRKALEALDAAGKMNAEGAALAAAEAERSYKRAIWATAGGLALAVLLSVICVTWLTRNVAGGASSLSNSLLRLSRRDYGFELPEASRGDEIGEMARAVATCRDGLREADALAAAQAAEAASKVARGERVDGLLRGFEAEAAEVLRGVASAAVELNATAGEMAGTAQDGVARA
ncbi:MCP four helix bundle domain-containing protein, partial [Muricoccus roseus]